MTVFFVCGGTAGHVNPAIAIAEELRSKHPKSKIIFLGADKAAEKRLVPEAGFDLVNIKMTGLRRGFSPRDIIYNIKTATSLIAAERKSSKLLKKHKPDAVVGTGGYISYPVLKKAAKRNIATFVLEPNAHPGLAVKMLSKKADKIFVTYKGIENNFGYPERVVYTGTPLRKMFLEHSESAESVKKDRKLVISFWGSLGASKMNEMMIEFIKRNAEKNEFDHIHAAGISCGAESLTASLNLLRGKETSPSGTDIREYIDDMPVIMRKADLVVCRAGASTIAELTALGKPAILIPSPYVTDNHQEINATKLCDAGGARMILEKDCTGEVLFNTVMSLLTDQKELENMSKAQKSLSVPNAASIIVDSVMKFVQTTSER